MTTKDENLITRLRGLLDGEETLILWLSTALDEPGISESMKQEIRQWIKAGHTIKEAIERIEELEKVVNMYDQAARNTIKNRWIEE